MDAARSQAFMGKIVGDLATASAVSLAYVGDRVGLFRRMAGAGPMTLDALQAKTGIHPRYLEEWLCTMFCAGYIEHDSLADTWTLPDEHAVFFANDRSEYYLGGLFKAEQALTAMAPRVADAYETGQGIPYEEFGTGLPLVMEQMNRTVYEARLISKWMPTLPKVVQRLEAGGRAIDIGCGTGLIAILLAKAYPQARISGLDADARSIEIARENARTAGVADRVDFRVGSAADFAIPEGGYDLVSSFDCIHELGDAPSVLRRIRAGLAPEGSYLMVEMRAAHRVEDNAANPFARMLYGFSCLHCLPVSFARGGVGYGACWGPTRARLAAEEAGFKHFAELPIKSPVLAFYEVTA